jgi:hypothetical protein
MMGGGQTTIKYIRHLTLLFVTKMIFRLLI